ncbi:dehydrogenase [Frigoribacterium sp. CFBP 8754]|uniref:dehydrogenase n=1 Tax=Frigoribacterium sp. CFBP 8754 TaxID=2775290 RepID=UPI00177EBBC7|nr:dehydrogenase [Frigoribacterium sp. CFBP 8754]MBD8660626.1 dehydrogenase [Frigoribacterium sp. CFBP 8754]
MTDPSPRSEALELALASQDVAAVAFALRHDVVVVPKLVAPAGGAAAGTDAAGASGASGASGAGGGSTADGAEGGAGGADEPADDGPVFGAAEQVRVFGRENTDKRILLLFSSADAYAAMVPDDPRREVMLYDADALRAFLDVHLDVLEQVFFDIAGPHTMAATPEDLLKALR